MRGKDVSEVATDDDSFQASTACLGSWTLGARFPAGAHAICEADAAEEQLRRELKEAHEKAEPLLT